MGNYYMPSLSDIFFGSASMYAYSPPFPRLFDFPDSQSANAFVARLKQEILNQSDEAAFELASLGIERSRESPTGFAFWLRMGDCCQFITIPQAARGAK